MSGEGSLRRPRLILMSCGADDDYAYRLSGLEDVVMQFLDINIH